MSKFQLGCHLWFCLVLSAINQDSTWKHTTNNVFHVLSNLVFSHYATGPQILLIFRIPLKNSRCWKGDDTASWHTVSNGYWCTGACRLSTQPFWQGEPPHTHTHTHTHIHVTNPTLIWAVAGTTSCSLVPSG